MASAAAETNQSHERVSLAGRLFTAETQSAQRLRRETMNISTKHTKQTKQSRQTLGPKRKTHIAFTLNGEPCEVAFAPHKTLLEVLREDLNLTGTKHGCELGECGACAVLVDGKPVLSCLVLGVTVEGREVLTVEGLQQADGSLHPLQTAFADLGAAQCGYCTPGFLLTAKELIEKNPKPRREEIAEGLAGNLCRCTGYIKIYEAVELAAARMRGETVEAPAEAVFGLK